MANDNILGTGEGESPIMKPPAANMEVRTMNSDIQSMNAGNPAPRPFVPQSVPMPTVSPAMPAEPKEQSFQIPQPTDAPAENIAAPADSAPKKNNKGLFTALIAFIVIVGLAALGYFVIYPIFFAPAPIEAPLVNEPVVPPAEIPPAEEPVNPNPEAQVPPEETNLQTHNSLFKIAADGQIESAAVISGEAVSSLILDSSILPNLTEITYKNTNGNLFKTEDILKSMLEIEVLVLNYKFNDQNTSGFVYTDASGKRWLGFVSQLADNTNLQEKITNFQPFLENFSFNNLFAGDPGTSGTWKTSQISGATDHRFLNFSGGFSVDYGWVGDKLVISTSFDGFKEAVRRLQ